MYLFSIYQIIGVFLSIVIHSRAPLFVLVLSGAGSFDHLGIPFLPWRWLLRLVSLCFDCSFVVLELFTLGWLLLAFPSFILLIYFLYPSIVHTFNQGLYISSHFSALSLTEKKRHISLIFPFNPLHLPPRALMVLVDAGGLIKSLVLRFSLLSTFRTIRSYLLGFSLAMVVTRYALFTPLLFPLSPSSIAQASYQPLSLSPSVCVHAPNFHLIPSVPSLVLLLLVDRFFP